MSAEDTSGGGLGPERAPPGAETAPLEARMEVDQPQTNTADSPGEAGGVAGGAGARGGQRRAGEVSGGELSTGRVPPGEESTPLEGGFVAEEERPNRSGLQGAEVLCCRFCDAEKLSKRRKLQPLRRFRLEPGDICFENPKKLPAYPPLHLPGSDRVCNPHYHQQSDAKKLHPREEDEGGTALEERDPGPAAGSGSTTEEGGSAAGPMRPPRTAAASPQDLFPQQHDERTSVPVPSPSPIHLHLRVVLPQFPLALLLSHSLSLSISFSLSLSVSLSLAFPLSPSLFPTRSLFLSLSLFLCLSLYLILSLVLSFVRELTFANRLHTYPRRDKRGDCA